MRLLKVFALGCAALILSALTGCFSRGDSRPANTQERKARIEQLLQKKYGDTFTVQTLERQLAQQAFAKSHYLAQVSSDAYPGQFSARVDDDCRQLEDDYPRLYWGNEIEQRAARAAEALPAAYDAEWKVVYLLTEQTWKSTDPLDDYLAQAETYVHFTVTLDSGDAAQTALALRDALQAENLQYTTTWKLDGATVTFGEMAGQTLTEQEICEKFERNVP